MTDTTAQLCVEDDTDLRVAANLEKEALRAYARFTYIEGWAELLAFCPDREAHEFEALVVSRKLLPHEIDPTGTAAIAASEALAWMRRVQPLDRLLPLWMPLPPPSRADYSKRAEILANGTRRLNRLVAGSKRFFRREYLPGERPVSEAARKGAVGSAAGYGTDPANAERAGARDDRRRARKNGHIDGVVTRPVAYNDGTHQDHRAHHYARRVPRPPRPPAEAPAGNVWQPKPRQQGAGAGQVPHRHRWRRSLRCLRAVPGAQRQRAALGTLPQGAPDQPERCP